MESRSPYLVFTLQSIAFVVNSVQGVIQFEREQVLEAKKILPKMEQYVEGAGRVNERTYRYCNDRPGHEGRSETMSGGGDGGSPGGKN